MSKQVVFKDTARKRMKEGIDIVAEAVRATIGPMGRNAILDKNFGSPVITNDGVSIAKEITLDDKVQNMGASVIKEVANKTNDSAGDGTSTATVLAHDIISEGMKVIAMGANPMNIRRGIQQAAQDIEQELTKTAKDISSHDEVIHVASVSAESKDIGKIIAETVQKTGHDGVITVEESQSIGINSEVVEGLQFNKGYISPYMVTDSEKMRAELKNPSILLTDQKISNIKEILPLLESLAQAGKKDLVIIADDIEGEALATFILNKLRGSLNILGIKAPGYGDSRKQELNDIAVITGATVIDSGMQMKLSETTIEHLGTADKIISTKDNTIIIGGKADTAAVASYLSHLKAQAEHLEKNYEQEKIKDRIAKLSGGVAVIKVGAATESEMKYLKDKIEDAVNATKAALEEGIVSGGGSTFVKIAQNLSKKKKNTLNDEERAGYDIVLKSLESPLRQIAKNAGKDDGVVLAKVTELPEFGGYNASIDKYVENMIEEGIIDPVKVTKSALVNACSAASVFLTTEVAVTDIPKENSTLGNTYPADMSMM